MSKDTATSSTIVRLFPLDGVVLFPHGVLPLSIFEPRYKQMTEEALAGDRRIAMAIPTVSPAHDPVPIHETICVGRIAHEVRQPDGRFKFCLIGETRMRIESELPMDGRLFRRAKAVPIADETNGALRSRRELQRAYLLGLLRRGMTSTSNEAFEELYNFLSQACPSGTFADVLSYACPFPQEVRVELLSTASVDRRLEILAEQLPKRLPDLDSPTTPIGFGNN